MKPPYLLAIWLVLGGVGCQTLPPPVLDHTAAAAQRQARLVSQNRWQFSGRLSVIQGEEGFHGRVRWQQDNDRYVIDLVGPLGQGRQQIRGDATRVALRADNGQTRVADDAETLVAQTLGVALPVSGLRYWVRGLAAPQVPIAAQQATANGQLQALQQAGWQLDFGGYRGDFPTRLTAERALDDGQTVKLQLVIDQWTRA